MKRRPLNKSRFFIYARHEDFLLSENIVGIVNSEVNKLRIKVNINLYGILGRYQENIWLEYSNEFKEFAYHYP